MFFHLRLASLLQDILCTVPRQPHEIQLIQELADQSLHEAGSSLVAYHYWLILSKMDDDLLEAKRLSHHIGCKDRTRLPNLLT